MCTEDREYFQQRAAAERALAQAAASKSVAGIHEEMAREYDALIKGEEMRPELRIVGQG